LGSITVKGTYVPGFKDSPRRPNLYQDLGLWQGTINIQLPAGTDRNILIPNERIPGRDPFDSEENQDFLIRRCKLKGVLGYQILPIDKDTAAPRGHHASRVIEISLHKKIDVQPNEELEVELQGFED